MSARRAALIAALALYALLWALAADGATGLVGPLAVPPVLALLVWVGLRLERYLGISSRRQQFEKRDDEPGA